MISKKAIILTFILVIISPIFGVILANMVGYHEPLDLAAESLGLEDISEEINWTPFFDYTVPGLPDVIGYIIAGFIGVFVVLGLGIGLSKIMGSK